MNRQTVTAYLLPLFISLALAAGFYVDGRKVTINNLSSDQWNILPVCIKLDHPDLYDSDLVADEIEDIDYYTPFFVAGVRFFTLFSNDNYIEGLNKFNFLINFLYTLLWFLFFFYLIHNLPIAILLVLLTRGILWLPGFELWGAGALWTALPRTAFLALLPLPMILLVGLAKFKNGRFGGAFALGLISNFHPISGLGLIIAFWFTDIIYQRFILKIQLKTVMRQSIILGILMIIGLSPYIYTYFSEVYLNKPQDPMLFNEILPLRIGEAFRNPFLALSKFAQLRWILFLGIPVLYVFFFYKRLTGQAKENVLFFSILLIVVFCTSVFTVPLERLIARKGLNLHMSFQLIRNIKWIMVSVYVFYAVALMSVVSIFKTDMRKHASWAMLFGFLIILLVSRIQPFNKLPIVGDDLIRTTLPNVFSIVEEEYGQDEELDLMYSWINDNISSEAKFIGPTQLRTACRRSVIFDLKGASMLIEGNPDKFVQWGIKSLQLTECKNIQCRLDLYKSWGTDFFLTDMVINGRNSEITIGRWNLYAL